MTMTMAKICINGEEFDVPDPAPIRFGGGPIWTTETPTKPGYYWLRNVDTHSRYKASAPQVVRVYEAGNGFPGNFDIALHGDDRTIEFRHIINAEWAGPLEPPR